MSEIPNHLKRVLGIEELKHNNSKYKMENGSHQIPQPMMEAMESILMERIHLGEEVTIGFCASVLAKMIDVWNDNIEKLKPEVTNFVGQNLLKEQDQQMSEDVTESEVCVRQKHATEGLEAVLQSLRPIVAKENYRSLEILSHNTVQWEIVPIKMQYCKMIQHMFFVFFWMELHEELLCSMGTIVQIEYIYIYIYCSDFYKSKTEMNLFILWYFGHHLWMHDCTIQYNNTVITVDYIYLRLRSCWGSARIDLLENSVSGARQFQNKLGTCHMVLHRWQWWGIGSRWWFMKSKYIPSWYVILTKSGLCTMSLQSECSLSPKNPKEFIPRSLAISLRFKKCWNQ